LAERARTENCPRGALSRPRTPRGPFPPDGCGGGRWLENAGPRGVGVYESSTRKTRGCGGSNLLHLRTVCSFRVPLPRPSSRGPKFPERHPAGPAGAPYPTADAPASRPPPGTAGGSAGGGPAPVIERVPGFWAAGGRKKEPGVGPPDWPRFPSPIHPPEGQARRARWPVGETPNPCPGQRPGLLARRWKERTHRRAARAGQGTPETPRRPRKNKSAAAAGAPLCPGGPMGSRAAWPANMNEACWKAARPGPTHRQCFLCREWTGGDA